MTNKTEATRQTANVPYISIGGSKKKVVFGQGEFLGEISLKEIDEFSDKNR